MKKLLGILLSLLALFALGCSAGAAVQPDYENAETGFKVCVADAAGLLSSEEKAEVIAAMLPVTDYGHALFLTTDRNPYGTSDFTDEYTVRYAQNRYYELFGNDDGVVILVDMDNRIVTLQSSGALYDTVTTAKANTITDNIYSFAGAGDYAGLAITGFTQYVSVLEGERIAQPMKHTSNAILALIAALFINFLIVQSADKLTRADDKSMMDAAKVSFGYTPVRSRFIRESRRYNPPASTGGGGHGGGGHSGGGFSGGGGHGGGFSGGGGHGGGGFSGGGGSHRF